MSRSMWISKAVLVVMAGAMLGSLTVDRALAGPKLSYYQTETPLMTIRFNQRHVYFERPLYTVVKRAVDVKPDVIFEVRAMTPQMASKDQAEFNVRQALAKVVNALQEIGVPDQQVRSTMLPGRATHPEINIFVR